VETNMMSFEKHGRRLNGKKQLVADDGTTLEANGKNRSECIACRSLTRSRSRLLCMRAAGRALLPSTNHGISAPEK
jgi:hypothetical protein